MLRQSINRLLKVSFAESKEQAKNLPAINDIQFECIPILTASQVIQVLNLQSQLHSIQQLAGISDTHFQFLYRPAINNLLEAAQLVPSSASHHHCGPGGFIIHTIEVIELALRQRRAKTLPLLADPEQIADEEHQWTYGIFCAALLHDAGKLIANTLLQLDTGAIWSPHCGSLLNTDASTYSVVFRKANYRLQVKSSITLFHLIPPAGRHWLAQNTEVYKQLSAWLYGEYHEFGIIGEITQYADRQSTAKNLGINTQLRFPNAPIIPLIERLMTALRYLLESEQIRVNRNGGGAWVASETTYLVCGAVAKKVIEHLQSMGATDIPTDNARLFDTWQEHGYAIATASGKAIWNMTIENTSSDPGETYSHRFTMLKFKTNTLFHPSIKPGAFSGVITVTAENSLGAANTNNDGVSATHTAETTGTELSDGAALGDHLVQPACVENSAAVDKQDSRNAGAGLTASPENSDNCASPPSPITTIYDPQLAEHFLEWLRFSIREGSIQVNKSKAMVHVVKEGVLLVTPRIFQKYVTTFDLINSVEVIDGAEPAEKRAFKLVQKQLEKKGLNIKAKNRMNVHIYKITGPHRRSELRAFLLPKSLVFERDCPEVNPLLESVSGVLKPGYGQL